MNEVWPSYADYQDLMRLVETLLTEVASALDADRLTAALDACLATEAERLSPSWPDPFAHALGPAGERAT